jgi:hypothetical protein
MLRSTPGFSTSGLKRALMAVGAAVVVASGLVAHEAVSRSPAVSVAGEAKMEMLRDEHALIAAYVANDLQARKLANAAADSDFARMRLAAQGEIRRQAHIAAAENAAPAAEVKTVALRTHERTTSARGTGRDIAVSEPLQVMQVAQLTQVSHVTAPQAVQPAQARVTDGPVRSRLRELASDVRRIPSLLHSAASWVADAVPAPKLPSLPALPMRRFSAVI